MESANSKPDNKTAASEEPKAKEQNDIAKENVAKSNNGNSIEATQEEGPSLKEVIKQIIENIDDDDCMYIYNSRDMSDFDGEMGDL